MIWVGWRQQRTEALVAGAILLLVAAVLVPTGIQMANAYHHDGLGACLAANPSFSCNGALDSFRSRFGQISSLINWLTLLPGLFGILLAAPFLIDLENGTHRLAWTQSISRTRWLTGKLGFAVGGTLLTCGLLVLLVTWWHAPYVHLEGRVQNNEFDTEGIVPLAYGLFALGLALAVGALWRRTAAALVVAFVGYFAARLFVDTWLRQRFLTPATATWPMQAQGPNLNHSWVLSQYPSDRAGDSVTPLLGDCIRSLGGHKAAVSPGCVAQHGGVYSHAVYFPPHDFWPLQGIETALFGGVALLLIALAARWTHGRAA